MRRTTWGPANPTNARRDNSPSPRPSPRPKPKSGRGDTVGVRSVLSPHHVFGGLLVLLVLVVQLLVAPHLPHDILRFFFTTKQQWHPRSPAPSLHEPILYKAPPVCSKPAQKVDFAGTFNTNTARSMALAEQAKRVAAEFDFAPDAVNKAVKEFIREMGVLDKTCLPIGY
jgi:hexokinase